MEAAGEWVALMVLEQEDEGSAPPRSGVQSVRGSAVWGLQFGAEGSSSSRLERLAGRCNRCSNAASHIFTTNLMFTWASR